MPRVVFTKWTNSQLFPAVLATGKGAYKLRKGT